MNFFLILCSFLFIFLTIEPQVFAENKPFKRVLIISGGGIVPGLGLGYIAGAEAMGWKPDIIIATCGAALPAVVYDKIGDAKTSLEFVKSEDFFESISKVNIYTHSLLRLQDKFTSFSQYSDLIPNFFSGYALYVPTYFHSFVTTNNFKFEENKSRTIILSARAHFHKQDVGYPKENKMKFSQVFMTDKDTATYLSDYRSPLKSNFPNAYIEDKTEVMTSMSYAIALRASISDPILMAPLMYGPDYYFTGASDLYPIELAHFLADEVVATYPMGMFSDYEEQVFKTTFGFSQTERALSIIKDDSVRWVDQTEFDNDLSFDPYPFFPSLKNGLPLDLQSYQDNVDKQYEFGKARMIEVLSLRQNKHTYLKHIRAPINKQNSNIKSGSGLRDIL